MALAYGGRMTTVKRGWWPWRDRAKEIQRAIDESWAKGEVVHISAGTYYLFNPWPIWWRKIKKRFKA